MATFTRTASYNGEPVQIKIDESSQREWFWRGQTMAYAEMPVELQNRLDDLMDYFEEGDNTFNGDYEILERGDFIIRRKAQIG